jgi:hypothetical protein
MKKWNQTAIVVICMALVMLVFYYQNRALNAKLDEYHKSLSEEFGHTNEWLSELDKKVDSLKYRVDNNKNGQSKLNEYKSVDLNKDGHLDHVSLENRGRGLQGDIYLIVNDIDRLIIEDYCEPNYKLYDMKLDYIYLEDRVEIFVELSQFVNGVGSNSLSYVYDFDGVKLTRVWASEDLETPKLITEREGEKIIFKKSSGEIIQENELAQVPVLDLDENGVSEMLAYCTEHWVTVPVSSKLVSRDGEIYVWVGRVIRGPLFLGFYESEYSVGEDAMTLVSEKVSWHEK